MAWTRVIKAELWCDAKLSRINPDNGLPRCVNEILSKGLYEALIHYVDYRGLMRSDIDQIVQFVVQRGDESVDIAARYIQGFIDGYIKEGLLVPYMVKGRQYLWMVHIFRHQKQLPRSSSQIPAQPEELVRAVLKDEADDYYTYVGKIDARSGRKPGGGIPPSAAPPEPSTESTGPARTGALRSRSRSEISDASIDHHHPASVEKRTDVDDDDDSAQSAEDVLRTKLFAQLKEKGLPERTASEMLSYPLAKVQAALSSLPHRKAKNEAAYLIAEIKRGDYAPPIVEAPRRPPLLHLVPEGSRPADLPAASQNNAEPVYDFDSIPAATRESLMETARIQVTRMKSGRRPGDGDPLLKLTFESLAIEWLASQISAYWTDLPAEGKVEIESQVDQLSLAQFGQLVPVGPLREGLRSRLIRSRLEARSDLIAV